MKYHFQYISKTAVRIELITEDKREKILIEKLALGDENNEELTELFRKGVQTFDGHATFVKLKFMNFPKVALCNYKKASAQIDDVA